MKNVLVVGGNGFIGKNIIESLLNNDINVSVYDRTKFEKIQNSYVGDIFNDVNFNNYFSNIDAVIYLVTTVSPKKSMDNPNEAYEKDVPLLIKTLECCKENNIKRLIFASSGGAIYGDAGINKSREDSFNQPINNYGICKLTCEKILQMYNVLYGMENISLRISNPYGEGQNSNTGVGVITTFADYIMSGKDINIYGDGSIVRDFIHVKDVADAFYLSLLYKYNNEIIPVFNIGSGVGLSINDIIQLVEDTFKKKANINYLDGRLFDVKYNVLDIKKAQDYLNYSPNPNETEKIKQYLKKRYLGD